MLVKGNSVTKECLISTGLIFLLDIPVLHQLNLLFIEQNLFLQILNKLFIDGCSFFTGSLFDIPLLLDLVLLVEVRVTFIFSVSASTTSLIFAIVTLGVFVVRPIISSLAWNSFYRSSCIQIKNTLCGLPDTRLYLLILKRTI